MFGAVTGLIYLVIIALWAAVLIPMWLRRHDQISEVRSTARFSSAMKSLSRVDDPERTERDVAHRDAAAAAARRRAIVLAGLITVVLLSLVGGFAGASPKWLPIVLATLLAAYLVAAAMTAGQRAASAQRRTEATDRRAAAEPARRSTADDDFASWDAWEDDDDSWAPVPATIPTYVNAPRATPVARPIDHAAGGVWSGSAMIDAANEMREAQRAVDARTETAEIPVVAAARVIGA